MCRVLRVETRPGFVEIELTGHDLKRRRRKKQWTMHEQVFACDQTTNSINMVCSEHSTAQLYSAAAARCVRRPRALEKSTIRLLSMHERLQNSQSWLYTRRARIPQQ
jgi:hypothetical protein